MSVSRRSPLLGCFSCLGLVVLGFAAFGAVLGNSNVWFLPTMAWEMFKLAYSDTQWEQREAIVEGYETKCLTGKLPLSGHLPRKCLLDGQAGELRDLIVVAYDTDAGEHRTKSILFPDWKRFPEGDHIKISVSKRDPNVVKLDRWGWLNKTVNTSPPSTQSRH